MVFILTWYTVSVWRSARRSFLLGNRFWPIVASLAAIAVPAAYAAMFVAAFVRGFIYGMTGDGRKSWPCYDGSGSSIDARGEHRMRVSSTNWGGAMSDPTRPGGLDELRLTLERERRCEKYWNPKSRRVQSEARTEFRMLVKQIPRP